MKETHTRSIIKGISYRIIGVLTITGIIFIFTGNANLSLGIGISEIFLKTLLFYSHERVWLNINWGKKHF